MKLAKFRDFRFMKKIIFLILITFLSYNSALAEKLGTADVTVKESEFGEWYEKNKNSLVL